MAQVSPEMHAEFVLPYEKRLLEPFALNGYGCCEDLTKKLDDVFTIPDMRRISSAPWAGVDICAEKSQDKHIFSWKPHPAHLVGEFNSHMIRDYIQHMLDATLNCRGAPRTHTLSTATTTALHGSLEVFLTRIPMNAKPSRRWTAAST